MFGNRKRQVVWVSLVALIALSHAALAQNRREAAQQRHSAQRSAPQRRQTPPSTSRPQAQARPQTRSKPQTQARPQTQSRSRPQTQARPQPTTRPQVRTSQPTRSPSASRSAPTQRSRTSITPRSSQPSTQRSSQARVPSSLNRSPQARVPSGLNRSTQSQRSTQRTVPGRSTPTRRYVIDNTRTQNRTSSPSSTRSPRPSTPSVTRQTPSSSRSRSNPSTSQGRVHTPSSRNSSSPQRGQSRNPVIIHRSNRDSGSRVLDQMRQGRRTPENIGVRRLDPVIIQRNQPRSRVVVDSSYHRRQSLQYRSKRHYPGAIVYHDQPRNIIHGPHYRHAYRDRYNRLYHHMIWPSTRLSLSYAFGSTRYMRDIYPYYHRKYVFVSIGGHWPSYHNRMRYYWYGAHPHQWYGYDPIPRQENNYYTYNYYDTPSSQTSGALSSPLNIVEAELPAPPQHQTPADQRFSEAVISFEDGQYVVAANLFRQAMMLDREDIIIPFAYAQALFADKEYLLAVLALRNALTHINPNENSIYYPRGLYKQDDDLYLQIDELMMACDRMPYDRNLKLLLGYHFLGIGETDAAAEYLQEASRTPQNAEGASVLLALIQQIRDAEKQVQMQEVKP